MLFHSSLWVTWSWISSLPMIVCTVYRYYTQEPFKKKAPERYYTDDVFRGLLFPGLFYYTIDSVNILLAYKKASWCSISYLVHHIITLAGAKTTLTLNHYPWFIMAPFAVHTVLIMFPTYTYLNYFYLLIIFFCLYGLRQNPWKNIKEYNWAFIVCVSLVCGPLVMLWLNGCKNDSETFNID